MELRRRWPERIEAVYPRVKRISLSLFAIVVLGAIASEHDTVREHMAEVAGAALALNVAAMTLSFAIALELGIHNSALAIAVGATLASEVTIPAAVYSSFMLFTGGAFAWVMSRRNVGEGEDVRAEPAEA